MGVRPPSGRGSGRGHERGVQLGNPLAAGVSPSIGDELGPWNKANYWPTQLAVCWRQWPGGSSSQSLPVWFTLGRGCLEVVRVRWERWINSNLFVMSNSDWWAFDLPIDRVNLIPPWNDKGVEDGARIITRKRGIDAHDEGGKSNEEVKSPHYTVIQEMILKYCMRHAYSISLLQWYVRCTCRPAADSYQHLIVLAVNFWWSTIVLNVLLLLCACTCLLLP